ncbi:OmpH family outer membrane protein [Tenacibaculum piscium]|uniref:Molecular chaperone Skp n=1 Tax=Tenacibaculum piscium TaxID=1458515 RepID=A0A2H1YJ65_9FLAO|nr:OmpH family outer membrane protein [Tenacibaculum piscium]MBE7628641.1 OmpH family outer membrane protein [Tenacibaculum piscium]MBE7669782.1 OmpH family outer membrane protein [Tenacibaculum piscium]MBE7684630.1 OmpH family outer membrane protein [Tenacibaculum piscium]MBE7689250.1 OmpH family outer membrane protein [Tenacibaculum piscium]MCG8182870.1 OmpH family outer membrane protein [Tenacibaculum piscium]
MKHFKTLLLVAIFTIGFGSIANAQKTAHINTDKLLSEMPATKSMKAELEKLNKTYRDDIEAMYKRLEAKIKKYEAEGKSQTQEVNQQRAIEVNQDRQRISKAEQSAGQEMQKKYQEKTLPILKKAEQAIKDVAAAKGIIYVYDAAPGKGLIVYDKGNDIYSAVKAKLGF